MTELWGDEGLKNTLPPDVSKAQFARIIGLSKARITQLIAEGMPVGSDGRIPRAEAVLWYEREKAPHRRRGLKGPAPLTPRAELEALRVEREKLALARDRGELVERRAVERAMFARARADRDALLSWATRISAPLAAELGADPAATFAALDRLAREHLAERADAPLEGLDE